MPMQVAVPYLLAVAGLFVAAFLSYERPYNILRESWRQTIVLLRNRPKWLVYAFGIYALQAALSSIVFSAPISVISKILLSIVVQASAIFTLAHVALRLHRGLICNEWQSSLIAGVRERRMALYVLACWVIFGILGHLPIPSPPSIAPKWSIVLGFGVYLLVLTAKAALMSCGPAASLDDPQPMRRAIVSFRRAPVAMLTIIFTVGFLAETVGQVLEVANYFSGHAWIVGMLSRPIILLAQTFLFAFSEFALVILLTRIWEDHYEPQTRYAPHNLSWT